MATIKTDAIARIINEGIPGLPVELANDLIADWLAEDRREGINDADGDDDRTCTVCLGYGFECTCPNELTDEDLGDIAPTGDGYYRASEMFPSQFEGMTEVHA